MPPVRNSGQENIHAFVARSIAQPNIAGDRKSAYRFRGGFSIRGRIRRWAKPSKLHANALAQEFTKALRARVGRLCGRAAKRDSKAINAFRRGDSLAARRI